MRQIEDVWLSSGFKPREVYIVLNSTAKQCINECCYELWTMLKLLLATAECGPWLSASVGVATEVAHWLWPHGNQYEVDMVPKVC